MPSEQAMLHEGLRSSKAVPHQHSSTKVAQAADAKANQPEILKGSHQFVKVPVQRQPKLTAHQGKFSFNFDNQPIDAVANSILGDLLHKDYTISEKVKGMVSYSSAQPVDEKQALAILETLLSWTDNALIKQGDRYEVLPQSEALKGRLVPLAPAEKPPAGLSAKLFPLDYISAEQMQKLLKPYAAKDAFLLVDPGRNVLVLAGTSEQLDNYQRTIETFDVNWLRGMSVGVFSLEHASVKSLIPQLRKVFGPDSKTPMAGMLRFLPIVRTNSVVAISPQAEYLNDIGRWIHTIDEGGKNQPQLYVYNVENIQATKLARYLRQIYGKDEATSDESTSVAPNLTAQSFDDSGLSGSGNNTGGISGNSGSSLTRSEQQPSGFDSADDSSFADEDSEDSTTSGSSQLNQTTRITAESDSNQLLIRTLPSQWREIQSAIRHLDVAPEQVQIETRILEVSLTGDLAQGVQWYLGRLAQNSGSSTIANRSGSQGALGGGGAGLGSSDNLFYSFVSGNLQVALHALETSGRTQVLSAPSLVVMNNQKARIQVGNNVPITETSINTDSDNTVSSVEYIETGVILDVKPRINPGGRVYLQIKQEVSDADSSSGGNPTIATRSINTQVAVHDGQTVLLGGLINQNNSTNQQNVPWLGRVPGLRWLFGYQSQSRSRSELLVLITPRIINDGEKAAAITSEYEQQMKLLQPSE